MVLGMITRHKDILLLCVLLYKAVTLSYRRREKLVIKKTFKKLVDYEKN